MSFSSLPTSSSFEHTIQRLLAAEISVAAFTSIRGGAATGSPPSTHVREILKRSQERAAQFDKIVSNQSSAAKAKYDPRLNAVLDRAFGRFSANAAIGSATKQVIRGIKELRIYQKTVVSDFRSSLHDRQDQESRNWASEEIVKIQGEIAQLNKLVLIPFHEENSHHRMAS